MFVSILNVIAIIIIITIIISITMINCGSFFFSENILRLGLESAAVNPTYHS